MYLRARWVIERARNAPTRNGKHATRHATTHTARHTSKHAHMHRLRPVDTFGDAYGRARFFELGVVEGVESVEGAHEHQQRLGTVQEACCACAVCVRSG
jgi:hypothetical protein